MPRKNGSFFPQLGSTGLLGSLISGLEVTIERVFSSWPAHRDYWATGLREATNVM